jgi:glyoxylase-like metal-dependent hydrolase (beta-lactamase superfamily II)
VFSGGEVEKIIEGIYFIPGQDEMIPDSHVYILGDSHSHDLSMVDVGLLGKGEWKLNQIEGAGIEPTDIKRIIFTHTHFDHIGCIKEIIRGLPDVEIWVHQIEGDYLERGDERIVHGNEMFAGLMRSQYGIRDGFYQFSIHRKLSEGEVLEIGGLRWEVLHIPGHSAGGIGLYNSENKVVIPGDTVYADYNIGRFDLYGAEGNQLRRSLERLAQLDAEVLLPGHNRILREGAGESIRGTLDRWSSYLG